MNRLKRSFKKRKEILIVVGTFNTFFVILYIYLILSGKMDLESFSTELVGIALSALVSTLLTMWLTRNDILEDDFRRKKEQFGVIAFEDGYKSFLGNGDSESILHIYNWKEFFTKHNQDKELDIVGVALRGFFEDENSSLPHLLLMLCIKNNFKINIILANPYSDEVKIQAMGQHKNSETHIADSIQKTYNNFILEINELDHQYEKGELTCPQRPSLLLKDRFTIMFCKSMPKAFIIRSGAHMIITPYQMQAEGPATSPTLIVKDADSNGFYEKYRRYIDRLKDLSISHDALQRHVSSQIFFDQSYGDSISQEFKDDLRECSSVDILGLGQNRMFTIFEHELIKLAQNGGKINAIIAKPDGASTKMCVARSLIHESLEDAIREHKSAINTLISIRDKHARTKANIKVYTWDCFFPYTMYGFNLDNPARAKMYIWITNLFAYSHERDGFIIDGRFEPEQLEKYRKQYEKVKEAAIKEHGEISHKLSLN